MRTISICINIKVRYYSNSRFQIVTNTMFVCVCSAVSDHQITDAINEGACSFKDLQDNLGVAQTCGTCSCEVKKILREKVEQALTSQGVQSFTVSRVATV